MQKRAVLGTQMDGEACREDKTRREGADSNAAPILQIISPLVATTTGSVFVQT